MRLVTDESLLAAAQLRANGHNGKPHIRPLVADAAVLGHWWIGLVGERAFSEWSGLPLDLSFRASASDGRADFHTGDGYSIDVKTCTRPYGLWVEADKPMADFFILALYRAPNEADLLGWASRLQVVAKAPERSRHGVVNHCVPISELNPL